MKFIVNSAYLLKQLSNINGVITTNPVVPILENFLFELEKGGLTVTASDLQTSMITELQVESKEKGSIAVPARILLDTLKNLPEQPVTFSIDESTYRLFRKVFQGVKQNAGGHCEKPSGTACNFLD